MTDDEKPETVPEETVEDAHETADKPEEAVVPPPEHDSVPDWGKGLIQRVETLEAVATAPVAAGVETATGEEMPGHGEEIDDSPVKPPWTHKPLSSVFGFKG